MRSKRESVQSKEEQSQWRVAVWWQLAARGNRGRFSSLHGVCRIALKGATHLGEVRDVSSVDAHLLLRVKGNKSREGSY